MYTVPWIRSPAEAEMAHAMIDGTTVGVHRHNLGANGGLAVRPSDACAAG